MLVENLYAILTVLRYRAAWVHGSFVTEATLSAGFLMPRKTTELAVEGQETTNVQPGEPGLLLFSFSYRKS